VLLEGNLEEHRGKQDGEMRLQESPFRSLFYPTDGYDMIWHDIFNCNWVDTRWH